MAPECPAAPRRPQRRKQERTGQLLDAALIAFSEKGFAATKAEEVAELAGVSKGTLYLYFDSKEALFRAAIRRQIHVLILEGSELTREWRGSAVELLRTLLDAWWRRCAEAPACGILKVLMSESGSFPELATLWRTDILQPLCDILAEVLHLGAVRHEFRAVPVDGLANAVAAQALLVAFGLQAVSGRSEHAEGFDVDAYVQNQLDLLIGGVRATGVDPQIR